MARALITGLQALVTDADGVNHAHQVFVVLDTDTGALSGHLDAETALDAAGVAASPEGSES